MTQNSKTRKFYPRLRDNIWETNLVEMGSLSSFNCSVKYALCVIDAFNKYAQLEPLKIKRS